MGSEMCIRDRPGARPPAAGIGRRRVGQEGRARGRGQRSGAHRLNCRPLARRAGPLFELRGEDSNLDFAVQSRADLPIIRPRIASSEHSLGRARFALPSGANANIRSLNGEPNQMGRGPRVLRVRAHTRRVQAPLRIFEWCMGARRRPRGNRSAPENGQPRHTRKTRTGDPASARGKTYVEIANELGLTKSTVAYHARRLGIPADERFARRYDWRLVQTAVDAGASMRQCMKRFGFSRDAWGKAVKRGDIIPNDWVTPLERLLIAGRRRSRGHIKARLLRAGLKENRCERCGLGEWRGKPLNMQLHHINGDGSDNRLENLELLCANCHSQTSTYGGRNGHRRARPTGDAEAV